MSKIVPFSRSAAYLYQRAAKNRREGHLMDALELMRRALEKDPENPQYEMDLAQILCELGSYVQSNGLLSDMIARDDSLTECYFGMACNFYGMNDADSAYKALMCFLSEDPQAADRQEVGELLHSLFIARTMMSRKTRRGARAARLAEKGLVLLRLGNPIEGEQLLKRSLSVSPRQSETRAVLALCLTMRGERDGALREIARALRPARPPMRTLCIAAQIYHMMQDHPKAKKMLDAAASRNPEGAQLRMLLDAACEVGAAERVFELAQKALAEAPYDRLLLHLCAAAIINTNRPQEHAAYCWGRIRRIQPDDQVASYYLSHPISGPIPYRYRLPDAQISARAAYLSETARGGLDGVAGAWAQPKLRRTVRWSLESGEPVFMRAGVSLLAAVETPESERLLRRVMIDPAATQQLKHQALTLLGLRGAKPPFLMTGEDKFSLASAGDSGQLPRLPLSYRRVLKRAVYTGMSIKEDFPARLTMLWLRFAGALGERLPTLRDLNGWAGALNLCLAQRDSLDVSVDELAGLFRCSRRKLEHMARRIERLVPPDPKGERDEAH
jgi:tetratricopeptide (TPR) repeat protein